MIKKMDCTISKNEKSYWPKNSQIIMIKNKKFKEDISKVIKTNLNDLQVLNLFNYF